MIPRVTLNWRDPAALVAVVALAIVGGLLLTDRAVPIELWVLITFVLGGHVSQVGSGQVIAAINGGARTALTHEQNAVVIPDRRGTTVAPVVVQVTTPPVEPSAPAAASA